MDQKYPDAREEKSARDEKSDHDGYVTFLTFYNGVGVGLPLFNCCSSRGADSTFPRLDPQPQPQLQPRLHILPPQPLPPQPQPG